jgi:hypothetical protein
MAEKSNGQLAVVGSYGFDPSSPTQNEALLSSPKSDLAKRLGIYKLNDKPVGSPN